MLVLFILLVPAHFPLMNSQPIAEISAVSSQMWVPHISYY